MKTIRRLWCHAVCLGLGLATLSGCQTWVPEAGLTLPTGHYLRHYGQYIPPTPPYPLPRELANQTDAARAAVVPPAPVPLLPGAVPAPVPGGP
jgi:hypothetical protein